jgi:charged multivesicular body protein 2A
MNLPQIQHIMMEFEKESEIMDMKEEMMSDTIDEAMEEEEDEEEQDAIVNQVLDEIGINLDDIVSFSWVPVSCGVSVIDLSLTLALIFAIE